MEMYAYISYIIYELNWIDLWIYRLTSVQKTLKIYTFCCAPTPKRRNISESGTHGYESKLWCPSKTLKTETVNLCKCALQSSNYGSRRIWPIHQKKHRGNPCNPAAPPSTSASAAVGLSTAISTWEVSLVVATCPKTSDMNTCMIKKTQVNNHLISKTSKTCGMIVVYICMQVCM